MFDAGCRWIMFGIEKRYGSTVKEIIKKLWIWTRTKALMDDCDEIGIFYTITFVTGFPYQTQRRMLKETIRYIMSLNAKVKSAASSDRFQSQNVL